MNTVMQQRRSSRFLSSLVTLFLLVLLSSRSIVPQVQADDTKAVTATTTNASIQRDATDAISDEAVPEQRRELFWSLTFLSKLPQSAEYIQIHLV